MDDFTCLPQHSSITAQWHTQVWYQKKKLRGSSLHHQGPRLDQLSHGVIFYKGRSTELKDDLYTTLISACGMADSTNNKRRQSPAQAPREEHTALVNPLTEVMCHFSVQQDVLIHCRLAAQKHCRVLDLELLTEPEHIYFSLAWVTRSPDRFLNLKIQEGHRVNKKPEEQRPFVPPKHREGASRSFCGTAGFL